MPYAGWTYLGTQLPRILNVDSRFHAFESYVQRGVGSCELARNAIRKALTESGKPVMISEENLSIGAFDGYAQGHPFSESREAKLDRLGEVLAGLHPLILVGLRPFRKATFSAYVEYQEQWSRSGRSIEDELTDGDVMGMYRYAELRQALESRWSDQVWPLAFEDIVDGRVRFPGFYWHAAGEVPNTRAHRRSEVGMIRELVEARPWMPVAKRLAKWSPNLALRLWSVKRSSKVLVPYWNESFWGRLRELEEVSDQARLDWLKATAARQEANANRESATDSTQKLV